MRHAWFWAVCLGLAAGGCGGPRNVPLTASELEKGTLSDVGELYRLNQVEKKKPPTKVADLTRLETIAPAGAHAIGDGRVIVRLGATLSGTEEGPSATPSDEVLAYFKEVPESGGLVLMLDRTVRTMTPEEFKAAPKAGTGDSSPAPAAKKK